MDFFKPVYDLVVDSFNKMATAVGADFYAFLILLTDIP